MRYVEVCQTLYDYEARTEDELSIKQDDVLYVIEKEDDDWWKAELKQNTEEQGPVGLVPATYLEPIQPIGRVRAEYDYVAQQEEELSFEEGDEMDLLETDDPDWYLVKTSQGHIGLAPSNYVQTVEGYEQPTVAAPPAITAITPPPSVPPSAPPAPVMPQPTGREVIADEAQSWNVHEYDPAKKKKKKGKGSLFIGNGMICYGSETDKASPVQQYHILDVTKYLYDGKILHIEIEGAKQAVLDLQAASKSEAKAILTKIADSTRAAQASNTHLNSPQQQMAAPAAAIATPSTYSEPEEPHHEEEEEEEKEEESNCVPKWGISLYSFDAEGEDELSVQENEQLYVLNYERTDGWWRVQKVDGEIGLVPSSYIQFDEDEDHTTSAAVGAAAVGAAAVAAAGAATGMSRVEDKEEIRRKREEEEHALYQQRIAEEEERERIRRREQEENERRRRQEEEEEERRRRQEEEQKESERRRQAQEAAKRAEAARQKQLEEDYKRKEAERKAALARSSSTKSNRHQDLPKPDPTKVRTWTDRSGTFKVQAQFIDFHNGKLRLHKLNGVKIDVPVEKMCPDDIRWVETHTRQPNTSPDPPTPAMPPRPAQTEKKVNERWDWFDWFMMVGIPMQASLQYASSFKAEKLDDSDIQSLTHKQMKTLGLKETHVQRVQRYIETGKPEPPEEGQQEQDQANQKERELQIAKDEEYARKLQSEIELAEKPQKVKSPASTARPRPSVSAPKDVHPDLLDLIGNQLTSSSDKGKAPESSMASGSNAIGFNDDAWAPRNDSSPLAALVPTKSATSTQPPPPPPPPPQAPPASVPTGPSPEEIQAAEAERKRRQEEEQIQKIQLMALQKQARDQQKQLEELQKLTQQQLELQKQLAMQTGTQQQQQQQQQKMMQIQSQQQQLQQQLAQQPQQLQPSFAPILSPTATTGFESQPTGFQGMQPTGFQGAQPTGFQGAQPTGFQGTQPTGFSHISPTQPYQAAPAGRPRPTPSHRLSTDPSLGQWQPPSQQLVQTNVSSSNTSSPWQGLQPQMTGFPSQSQPIGGYQQPSSASLPPPLNPNASSASAAGQQGEFNSTGVGLQRAQTISAQPTGRHWGNATPANPFGSPTLSPLQAQMTGVQFSTPSPQAFHQSPLQSHQPTGYMQPQMTGFPQQQAPPPPPSAGGSNIFTPQGS
ncbi:Actin cytoskeleton-regulatory complex protein sla1, partial [Choanephora cucurbitarum]